MPLFVNGQQVTYVPQDIMKFVSDYTDLTIASEKLRSLPSKEIGQDGNVLYVGQREFAAVSPDTENIDFLGTDDATTCHIFLIKHTGSGVVCLGHLDGCQTKKMICNMVKRTKKLSYGGPDGRMEVILVGGFLDDRALSKQLTHEVIRTLININDSVYLTVACFSDMNDMVHDGVHYPIIYGIAVEIKTGELFPAAFIDKGPDANIRSAATLVVDEVREIFSDGFLRIGPFDWFPNRAIIQYVNAPDCIIRQQFSTSPEQEPPYFEQHIRQSITVLRDHPQPLLTLFPDGHPHLYYRSSAKTWTLLGD